MRGAAARARPTPCRPAVRPPATRCRSRSPAAAGSTPARRGRTPRDRSVLRSAQCSLRRRRPERKDAHSAGRPRRRPVVSGQGRRNGRLFRSLPGHKPSAGSYAVPAARVSPVPVRLCYVVPTTMESGRGRARSRLAETRTGRCLTTRQFCPAPCTRTARACLQSPAILTSDSQNCDILNTVPIDGRARFARDGGSEATSGVLNRLADHVSHVARQARDDSSTCGVLATAAS